MKAPLFEGMSVPAQNLYRKQTLAAFLKRGATALTIDVRSPKEFAKGHIAGAVNIPLFTDEERAEVGTLYVRVSREAALERGFELVGPKLASFIREVKALTKQSPQCTLCVYCWRGGMRSNSMAWLLSMNGYDVTVLEGGYKSYRKGLEQLMVAHPWHFKLLGGMTGCGKTDVLQAMQAMGAQVLDLEGLAHHKGSAFGHLGMAAQPTTESFENKLFECMRRFDPKQVVWIEAESQSIGSVFIPQFFFKQMRASTTYLYEIPQADRLARLCKDYGNFDREMLKSAFLKIQKRLGYDQAKNAIAHLEQGDVQSAACIALKYYDKSYQHCFNLQDGRSLVPLAFDEDEPKQAAATIIKNYNLR